MERIMAEQSAVGIQPSADEEILRETGFYWRETDGIKILVCRPIEDAGFVNGFSTRMGGVSPFPENSLNLAGFKDDARENIYENRRRFLTALGGEYKLALALQTHSDKFITVDSPKDANDSDTEADAVISDAEHVLAGVKTADCVPVLIADPVTWSFAAVHAGWRGTVQSIAVKAIMELQRSYGAQPRNMIAAVGPAASCKMYEIGQDVIDQFASAFVDSERYFTPTGDGHALVDLHNANRDQLIKAQVPPDQIYVAPLCTMERADLFFSYRREKQDFGRTGRLLSVIGRR
jgi:YfiH family protein